MFRCPRNRVNFKREGQSATDDYLAREDAEREKMAKLRELRLAAEAQAGKPEAKGKRKAGGKAKR